MAIWVKWWDREEERTKQSSDGGDTTEDVWIDILFKYLVTPRVWVWHFEEKRTRNSWSQNRYSGLEKNRDPSVRWRMQANHTRNSARGGCHHSKNYNDGVVSKVLQPTENVRIGYVVRNYKFVTRQTKLLCFLRNTSRQLLRFAVPSVAFLPLSFLRTHQ